MRLFKSCHHFDRTYYDRVQLDWKPVLRTTFALSLVAAVTLIGAGCSGISTTQSVSPATFLIPGFFGQAPTGPETPATPLPERESVQTIAQSN